MTALVPTLLLALVLVALMFMGLGVKMFFKKHGEFKRHCSSMDPYTGKGGGCVCAKASSTKCKNAEKYSPLEVNKNLMEEIGQ